MERTTIMLSSDIKTRATRRARELGMSLGEFIRKSLESALDPGRKERIMEDSFFSDRAVFQGEAPTDLSRNHDQYLYEDKT